MSHAVRLVLEDGGRRLVLRGPLPEPMPEHLAADDDRQFEVDVSHLALCVTWENDGGRAQARASLLVDEGLVDVRSHGHRAAQSDAIRAAQTLAEDLRHRWSQGETGQSIADGLDHLAACLGALAAGLPDE